MNLTAKIQPLAHSEPQFVRVTILDGHIVCFSADMLPDRAETIIASLQTGKLKVVRSEAPALRSQAPRKEAEGISRSHHPLFPGDKS